MHCCQSEEKKKYLLFSAFVFPKFSAFVISSALLVVLESSMSSRFVLSLGEREVVSASTTSLIQKARMPLHSPRQAALGVGSECLTLVAVAFSGDAVSKSSERETFWQISFSIFLTALNTTRREFFAVNLSNFSVVFA